MARFDSLMIKRDLFGTVRQWGRIRSTQGREVAQDFPTETAEVLMRLAAATWQRGYRDH